MGPGIRKVVATFGIIETNNNYCLYKYYINLLHAPVAIEN